MSRKARCTIVLSIDMDLAEAERLGEKIRVDFQHAIASLDLKDPAIHAVITWDHKELKR